MILSGFVLYCEIYVVCECMCVCGGGREGERIIHKVNRFCLYYLPNLNVGTPL